MLPRECLGLEPYACECGKTHKLQVCRSNAGFYLGYWCYAPLSRESDYFPTKEAADLALLEIDEYRDAWGQLPLPNFLRYSPEMILSPQTHSTSEPQG